MQIHAKLSICPQLRHFWFQILVFRFWISDFGCQIWDFRSWVWGLRFQIADSFQLFNFRIRFEISDLCFQILDFRLFQISNFGFQISDFGYYIFKIHVGTTWILSERQMCVLTIFVVPKLLTSSIQLKQWQHVCS